LNNSAGNSASHGGSYDGLVGMITRDDGDRVCVELVNGRMSTTWWKRDTEPHPDPRSDLQRLEFAFMAACRSLDMKEVYLRYHRLGSPCLRDKCCFDGFMSGQRLPLDALYESYDDGVDEAPEGIGDVIDFLQRAGCRLSSNVSLNNSNVFVGRIAQGLKVDHIDYTDLDCDCGMGWTIWSQTAVLFFHVFHVDFGAQGARAITEHVLALLRAGIDMWPLHLPGISANIPPPETEITSPARHQMASILWPDLVPRCEDRDEYYNGPELALLIEQACAVCQARRREANWERRRLLLMCYVRYVARTCDGIAGADGAADGADSTSLAFCHQGPHNCTCDVAFDVASGVRTLHEQSGEVLVKEIISWL